MKSGLNDGRPSYRAFGVEQFTRKASQCGCELFNDKGYSDPVTVLGSRMIAFSHGSARK